MWKYKVADNGNTQVQVAQVVLLYSTLVNVFSYIPSLPKELVELLNVLYEFLSGDQY